MAAVEQPVPAPAGAKGSAFARAWSAIRAEAADRKPWIAAAGVTALVTLATLGQTYDGFFSEAIRTPAAWALILVNMAVSVVLVLALSVAFKPQRKVMYAVLVALGFQTLVATDLEIQPLAGTDAVGTTSSVNLGAVYSPVEGMLSGGIENPVEDAKRAELADLRSSYSTPESLATLRSRLDDTLATESGFSAADRTALMKTVDGLLARPKVPVGDRVRDVGLAVYAEAGRDPVQDVLAAK